jgi:hypothetical protein
VYGCVHDFEVSELNLVEDLEDLGPIEIDLDWSDESGDDQSGNDQSGNDGSDSPLGPDGTACSDGTGEVEDGVCVGV